MGSRFRAADETNPDGYWEDLDWRDLNDALYRRAISARWYCWIAERLYGSRMLKAKNAAEYVANEWGIKDPQLCDVLSLLQERVFPIFVGQQRYIRLHRDPVDVAASMVRCYGVPREEAMRIIRLRTDLLDQSLEGKMVLDIRFTDIVSGTARSAIEEWL
jgi:hypothetical protein